MTSPLLTNRTVPDYTGDSYWANVLCKKLEAYYHKRGHTKVKFWVETGTRPNGSKYYGARSNVVMDCKDIKVDDI